MQEFVNGLQSISENNIKNQDLQINCKSCLYWDGFFIEVSYFLSLQTING